MMSLDNLKTTLNAIKYLLTDYPKKKDIPTKLPNPNPLTSWQTAIKRLFSHLPLSAAPRDSKSP